VRATRDEIESVRVVGAIDDHLDGATRPELIGPLDRETVLHGARDARPLAVDEGVAPVVHEDELGRLARKMLELEARVVERVALLARQPREPRSAERVR